ncbi:MAG: PorP/SprF family type IX secretion system membrane protein [Chitinophagaceae bacterium]|nr:PorP/SprF family type IX secretion system membrane protein [Chitinophagaceae bacterium]
MTAASAQDLHFSQFFEAPLLRNPSLAGIFNGDIRVQAVYRDQWNSFTNAYRTGSLNAEYKMPVGKGNDFITTGLQLLFDKAGTAGLTSTHVLPALNYHKSLSDQKLMYLSVGFMGGLVQKSIDRSKVTTNNQYDGSAFNPSIAAGESFTGTNFSYFDGSFGASFNTSFGAGEANSLFAGVAYHHFNRPSNSFYRTASSALNPKIVFSTGIKFNVNDNNYFTLQADHSVQGNFNETIGGAMYSYKIGAPDEPAYTLHGGAFLRWGDAFIPVVKIDYNPFSVALSYDVNVSSLKTASQSRGGFELSVSWMGFLDRDNSARDKVLCPRF